MTGSLSISRYSYPLDSRKLSNSTLSTHVRHIHVILNHFRGAYKEIFISAHSLGGLSTLIANPEGVAAMSFWDPSTNVANFWASGPYLTPMTERRQYQLDYGNIFVIGEEMVEEIRKYPDEKCLELAKQITTPSQFVIPEESIFNASPNISPENYAHAFAGPFDLQRVAGADHIFSNRGNREKLFNATLSWFNKFSAHA